MYIYTQQTAYKERAIIAMRDLLAMWLVRLKVIKRHHGHLDWNARMAAVMEEDTKTVSIHIYAHACIYIYIYHANI